MRDKIPRRIHLTIPFQKSQFNQPTDAVMGGVELHDLAAVVVCLLEIGNKERTRLAQLLRDGKRRLQLLWKMAESSSAALITSDFRVAHSLREVLPIDFQMSII